MKFIKIPVTNEMEIDLEECEKMAAVGKCKACSECSLNAGDEWGCLGDYEWCEDVKDLIQKG